MRCVVIPAAAAAAAAAHAGVDSGTALFFGIPLPTQRLRSLATIFRRMRGGGDDDGVWAVARLSTSRRTRDADRGVVTLFLVTLVLACCHPCPTASEDLATAASVPGLSCGQSRASF